jgi:hypothetical protein
MQLLMISKAKNLPPKLGIDPAADRIDFREIINKLLKRRGKRRSLPGYPRRSIAAFKIS